VVFTVEYSIRSAQTAVNNLLKLNRKPPAVYQGQYRRARFVQGVHDPARHEGMSQTRRNGERENEPIITATANGTYARPTCSPGTRKLCQTSSKRIVQASKDWQLKGKLSKLRP
jgi:hypothetical protein